MKRHDRILTDAEADELEQICIASDKRPLTYEELKRIFVLQGYSEEDSAWLADAGGLPKE